MEVRSKEQWEDIVGVRKKKNEVLHPELKEPNV